MSIAGALVVTPEELASLIAACGLGEVRAADIRADLRAGAPSLDGGTKLDLLAYLAWLIDERTEPLQADAD